MNKGFTLIELLVVVLIIGILAAIALPQYQKAVERSRMAEAIQVLGNFAQAQSIYYMQHNVFAENINEGDITLSEPGDAFEYEMDGDGRAMVILMARRASGMYEGGLLGIGVQADGTILKACDGPEGFCPMAEPAGYEFLPGELGYGEGNNNGGNGGRPDPGTIIINPGTITCDTQPECAPPSVPVGCFCRYPTSS